MIMNKGIVKKLLYEVYSFKSPSFIEGSDAIAHQRIIKLQLTLKTGLSMNKYSDSSIDSIDEVNRIINVLKSPEFGLEYFKWENYAKK